MAMDKMKEKAKEKMKEKAKEKMPMKKGTAKKSMGKTGY